ncbi:uncharacterized protein G2W53_027389 [Senna tora]|uniref:Uncharacterized protein n=1 Tax=Senna tora TaxID=362788 RepID=A0A834TIY7_9FABA|nr:uncharacterized protein G2W53_027389 [Senna tora]
MATVAFDGDIQLGGSILSML